MSRRRGASGMSRGRSRLLLAGWVLALAVMTGRAAELQLVEASDWRALAERQHRASDDVPASRGGILDRDGLPLALSHEAFRIGVAPHELADRDAASELLSSALGLTPAEARDITRSERRWVQLAGRYPPAVREAVGDMVGIYAERELRRFHPQDDLAIALLGRIVDETGAGGIEQEFENHLRGVPGSRVVTRDSSGEPIPGEGWELTPPIPGGDVVLTIDMDLQEIAQEALASAVSETGAQGGDLVVTDPGTGEVLAMASVRDGATHQATAITTPSEPGSTLKPFTVAGLLERGRAELSDSVDTGEGHWTRHGRTIRDVTPVGTVTLSHALQVSSNVGIAKAAEVLSPAEQFETLRDFGFGVPTGIELPGESGGVLHHPNQWSGQSAASLAIGYEISATPLQIAMAYGALANGGELMEPRIVRELRAPDGQVVERFEPRAVRRVVRPEVAAQLTGALVDAVEQGTGGEARLRTFAVAGKSGTARATGERGQYETGAYHASFVGFFPAEAPQLVVFVKLDRPQGAYYGGTTAAPVTRATMEAVLAARHPPLDRDALVAIARSQEEVRRLETVAPSGLRFTSAAGSVAPEPLSLPRAENGLLLLPDVADLPSRTAIRRLHALGVRIRWEGAGTIVGTRPAAGTPLAPGDTVTILARPGSPSPPGPHRLGSRSN